MNKEILLKKYNEWNIPLNKIKNISEYNFILIWNLDNLKRYYKDCKDKNEFLSYDNYNKSDVIAILELKNFDIEFNY